MSVVPVLVDDLTGDSADRAKPTHAGLPAGLATGGFQDRPGNAPDGSRMVKHLGVGDDAPGILDGMWGIQGSLPLRPLLQWVYLS